MNAAQFDLPHDSYRLKCEELITSGKWKIMSQGMTSLDTGKENDNKYDESLSSESYVLVFMVIDNFWNKHVLWSVFTLVDTDGQLMVMKEFKLSQRFKEKTVVKR